MQRFHEALETGSNHAASSPPSLSGETCRQTRIAVTPEEHQDIRILIVDAHAMLRDCLRGLLEIEPNFRVIGETACVREAVTLLAEHRPEIVLLDIPLSGVSGFFLLEHIKQKSLNTKAIVLTAIEDETTIAQTIRQGASGFVLKKMATQQLIDAIQKVHRGSIWLDAKSQAVVMRCFNGFPRQSSGTRQTLSCLSRRERQVVRLVSKGYRNREIARELSITQHTVCNHIHNVLQKLGVSDRVQIALCVMQADQHAILVGANR